MVFDLKCAVYLLFGSQLFPKLWTLKLRASLNLTSFYEMEANSQPSPRGPGFYSLIHILTSLHDMSCTAPN